MNTAKERILVVDDTPDNLFVMQTTLEHAGYEVVPAVDGEEALALLLERRTMIDLILSDVMMPGLSGYELCHSLRQDPRYAFLPIVLITAKRLEEEDALHGMNVGADEYLTRPIDPRMIIKKIQILLSRKQALEYWQAQYQTKREELDLREWSTRMLIHDLTNPLSSAMMCANLLAVDPDLTPRQGSLVEKIKRSCQRQKDMMQDILLTAAAQNGKLRLTKEGFDLSQCVQEQITLQEEVITSKQMTIHCVGMDTGWNIIADRRLIERVVANLLVNALKYGKYNAAIDVWLGPSWTHPWSLPKEGHIAFVIANEGHVIPKQEQEQLFKPFSQGPADGGGNRNAGVGLGLCFCHQVVKLHGGAIGVFSPVPGRQNGAAFYFILP